MPKLEGNARKEEAKPCPGGGVSGTCNLLLPSSSRITMYRTLRPSAGRVGKIVAGGASESTRLEYLSGPEYGGRQPRIRHNVNNPLRVDPQLVTRFSGRPVAGTARCEEEVVEEKKSARERRPRTEDDGRAPSRHRRLLLPQQLATRTPQRRELQTGK